MDTERLTRKFKLRDEYRIHRDNYFLLPFRFHKINESREILVNEIGDFLIVPTGTAEKIITKSFKQVDDEVLYADLIANFFISLTPIPALFDVYETRYRTRKSFLDYFTSLHIFVITLRCEHTCHYCQVSRVTENKDTFDMSVKHINIGIDMMMRSPNPHVTMEFQGGEALLAFDKIKYAIRLAKKQAEEHRKTITFVVCTNLAPLNEEMLIFFKAYSVLISTSLDGPDFIHNQNRHRPLKNSHELAVKGIQRCREALGEEAVSALLTTSNLSLKHPYEIVDEYIRLGFRNIFLRPISPYGFAIHNERKNKYDTELFLSFYKTALKRIIEYNLQGYFLREDYTTIILKKILTPFPVGYVDLQSPSGMINNVIVFNYDGKVYASDEARMLAEMNDFTFQLGHLDINSYEEVFYGTKAREFAEVWTNESLSGCSECAFQSYCGSDPVFNYSTQGDIYGYRPTSVFCQKNMEIIRYLFELMDNNENGINKVFQSWITGKSYGT